MTRMFGTDGVRGIANADLTCELAFRIGQAGAKLLTNEAHRPRILIARDSRISGDMLRFAITAGIASVGADAVDIGILPTPGAAYLVRAYEADAAVVISASHNSFEYNGIKWFNGEGFKLSDEIEDQIEAMVGGDALKNLPTGDEIGSSIRAHNALNEYVEYLASKSRVDCSGLKVVLDCANGAASIAAPKVFQQLGAEVYAYSYTPDGVNINAGCGSTHPGRLRKMVVEQGADVGFAFDGDADRLISVDEFGVLIDGDIMLSICGVDMKMRNELKKNTIVGTVMTNLGMMRSMQSQGIDVVCTDVGDRYVLERMRSDGFNLGGEQSGHLIFFDHSTTGDGILSAIQILNIMAARKEQLSTLAKVCEIYPQILINVEISPQNKSSWREDEVVQKKIAEVETRMAERGRVLVRASGTEPLLRVMLEGQDEQLINEEALEIARVMVERFEGHIRNK